MPGNSATSHPAVVCEHLSADLSGLALRDIEVPAPGPAQVLVRVRAAALNYPDLLMTRGGYQFKPPLPFVPGMEAAGEIIACGDTATHLKPGMRVMVHARHGALAGAMLAGVGDVHPIPAGLDYAAAAALQVAALTAWVALVQRARLMAGETVLVHGATGGVGMAAVQLARHLGATVIATGRDPEKLATVLEQGAHHALAADATLRDRVMALTGERGVDVVFDPIGGDLFDASLRCMGWGGRLLVVGFVAGRIPEVKANYILIKNLSIIGVRAGEVGRRDPALGAENQKALDRLASQGVFRPHIGARLALADAVEGFRLLERAAVPGKIVIDLP
jgi:NADPH2:quinone reductase